MKARILKCVLSCLLVFGMAAGCIVGVSADREMAYNIYSNPDLKGETMFDTYVIDFMSTDSAPGTYWALANFQLHLSSQTKAKYKSIYGGGGYAGLQDRGAGTGRGHSAIMSFWEWFYTSGGKTVSLRADRVYPDGKSEFTGEGEGTNCITPYGWQDNQWYRMVIHTWTDSGTGRTFMGQWFQDLTTGEWTLISYFDTMLYNSCLTGNLHFFMENYTHTTSGETRDGYFKNMYIKTHDDKQWVSVDKTNLSHCNNVANNKIGAHSFGSTDEYFWAKSGGAVPSGQTQAQHDKAWPAKNYSITQPAQPTLGTPKVDSLSLSKESGEWVASWDVSGTPQLSYKLVVKDAEGKTLIGKTFMTPEAVSHELEGVNTDAFTCSITINDVFGNSVTQTESTEEYKALMPEEDEDKTPEDEGDAPVIDENENENNQNDVTVDDNNSEIDEQPEDENTDKKKDDNTVLFIIGIAAGVVVAAGIVAVVLMKKKKE